MTDQSQQRRPSAWLLDLTRLISRVGRGPMTGIDRVEAAYLFQLLSEPTPLFGVVRTSLGFVLLDRKGLKVIQTKLQGSEPWGKADFLSKIVHKSNPNAQRTESDLRRLALKRAPKNGLGRMLTKSLPEGIIWLNVGHTNLSQRMFNAVHKVKNARAHIMVHDMIPLLYPDYQRPGTVQIFERRMRNIASMADFCIYNSQQTQRDTEHFFKKWGRVPECVVALLGIDRPEPNTQSIPTGLDLTAPYFVTTGTIEPRKNHALLLNVWDELSKHSPPAQLVIIGNRGWNNQAVFDRLDAKPAGIIELNNLDDPAMAAIVKGAKANLFPSLAEGFGFPPGEAILLGSTVIAHELDVTKEILGNIPIYANALDMYSWVKIIREQIAQTRVEQKETELAEQISSLPNWQDHFNLVLNKLG